MTGQLLKACISSSLAKGNDTIVTSKMTHSLRRHQPFNISMAVIFVTAYIISALVSPGVGALKCFQCNSKLDPRCGEPFNNYTIALVDCDQQRENDIPHLDDKELNLYNRELDEEFNPIKDDDKTDKKPKSLCRKTMQTINDELSVVRGCGWVKNFGSLRNRKCFSRTGTHQIQMYHCVCEGKDGCNGADQSTFSFALLLLPLVPAYIFQMNG